MYFGMPCGYGFAGICEIERDFDVASCGMIRRKMWDCECFGEISIAISVGLRYNEPNDGIVEKYLQGE